MPCEVDLTQMGTYPDYVVPDEHVEICLKVLRTIRDAALTPPQFRAETALILSYAHGEIYRLVEQLQEQEKKEQCSPSTS